LYVRERNLPKLAPDWVIRWLGGASNPVTATTVAVAEPPPAWLTNQFVSVTNLGIQNVRVNGRLLHRVEIFECRNLR